MINKEIEYKRFKEFIVSYIDKHYFIKSPSVVKDYMRKNNTNLSLTEKEELEIGLITVSRKFIKNVYEQGKLNIYRDGNPLIYQKVN